MNELLSEVTVTLNTTESITILMGLNALKHKQSEEWAKKLIDRLITKITEAE